MADTRFVIMKFKKRYFVCCYIVYSDIPSGPNHLKNITHKNIYFNDCFAFCIYTIYIITHIYFRSKYLYSHLNNDILVQQHNIHRL